MVGTVNNTRRRDLNSQVLYGKRSVLLWIHRRRPTYRSARTEAPYREDALGVHLRLGTGMYPHGGRRGLYRACGAEGVFGVDGGESQVDFVYRTYGKRDLS
jgi:hypothetical protein